MWVWLKLKLTPKGDFCVINVRPFFVNFFIHSTKRYLNGPIWWLSIPNTQSETKICNLHPKAVRPASPSLLYGSPPGRFDSCWEYLDFSFRVACVRLKNHLSRVCLKLKLLLFRPKKLSHCYKRRKDCLLSMHSSLQTNFTGIRPERCAFDKINTLSGSPWA